LRFNFSATAYRKENRMQILTKKQENLLKEERNLLRELRVALANFNASADDQTALEESIQQLDDFFLLVIVGEFNAGKSAFINALLGDRVLKEGVTPTTTQVNILRYGQESNRQVVDDHLHILTAPVEILSEISIVDTPGTNAIIREHEEITSKFVPRSDLVLFITSADRPFTESERAFLENIRDWGKKVVVVINKIDILQNDEDLAQIQAFISENTQALFGITPEIFPISARSALQAKQGQPELWNQSRFEVLENYIQETLDEASRLQLKFLNPLGVGRHLAERYLDSIQGRLDLLKDDFSMLEDVEQQLSIYAEDMRRDFEFRMSDVDNLLYEMEKRGDAYFDETMRLARVFDLIKKDRIQAEFAAQVVADSPQRIEQKVNELIDWMVDSDLRQWQAVTEHIAERRREHKDRIVGDEVSSSFHYDRERLIEGIGREAKRVVDTYDKVEEAHLIAQGAQNAVAAAAVLEVGALGLGALVATIATTMVADVTGILLTSLIAALGLFVIPARRRRAKREMSEKIAQMRRQLSHALRSHFDREINRSLQQVENTISPYTRFVRAERDKNQRTQSSLKEIHTGLGRLQTQINDLD
jgi:small GTP-binding protein